MPIIEITLIEGRPPNMLREFAHAVTQAAHDLLDAPAESVRVIVHPVPPGMFFVGGKHRSALLDSTPPQDSR
ncbi:tautomerase family protein [Mycolicibacterium tusciae]|uniref:tautomerase family protein n=1 Tax=Mycolicibacterium tusciae TaxID=75922 RepID=UPI00024A3FAE|nr:tautomerase family protein [Mycolicibacterium tusciae]